MRFFALLPAAAFAVAAAGGKEAPAPAPIPDPEIQKMMAEVSAERIQRSIIVLASFKTRHTYSDPLPSGDGIGGAGAWIRAEFERVSSATGNRLRVDLDEFKQAPHPLKLANIVATLPGTGSGDLPVYVVAAHYDSRVKNALNSYSAAPGADDDASGVAAVVELARVMAGHEFGATLVFIALTGAEQGRLGSTHWAAEARKKGLNIAGMINDDIIGSSHGPDGQVDRHTVRLFAQGVPPTAQPDADLLALIRSGGENDTPPRQLARAIRDAGALYLPSMTIRLVNRADRYLRGGDQTSFLEQGFPAVRFTEAIEDFRHQREDVHVLDGVSYGDIPEFIDYGYVADVTRLNAAALAALARAPAPPRSVAIDTERRENDTTLSWAPSGDPNLAGYRIVWRESTALSWEHGLDVAKDVARVTVRGISKDNMIFGVETFDLAGHVSPAVFPMPSDRTQLP